MRWNEFELEQSKLAELGRRRLGDPGVVLVGTIRSDGSPRLSPVEPLFWNEPPTNGCPVRPACEHA